MLMIIKNNWRRLMVVKQQIFLTIVLTAFSVILAIIMTNRVDSKINIAVVGDRQNPIEGNNVLKVTYMEKEPGESALILNKYDAIVIMGKGDSFKIKTIKGKTFHNELKAMIQGTPVNGKNLSKGRSIGTNIIGYMLMFIMMQGIVYTRFFGEDKEKHAAERILASPIGFAKYIVGHAVFSWIFTFIPTFLILVIAKLVGATIGFHLWQYAVLLTIVSGLSTCFAVCLQSFFDNTDTASMLGNSLIIITCVISGSFYSMEKAGILHKLLYVIPFKDFLHFVADLERQNVNSKDFLCLIYVIICSVVLAWIGVVKTRKEYSFRS